MKNQVDAVIDDELAKKLGLESLEQLRERLKDRWLPTTPASRRMKLKRAMLNQLAEMHDFPVPEGMVEMEFNRMLAGFRDQF